VAQNALRQIIGDIYPLFAADDPRHGHVDFAGSAGAIEFLSSAPLAFGHSGRLRFRLFLDRRAGHGDLVILAVPELATAEGRDPPISRTLLADVTSVEFSYFGQARADKAARWHDAWVNETTLPQLVRVRVPTPPDDARAWPELTIAPRLNVDEGCVYDALSKRCQGR